MARVEVGGAAKLLGGPRVNDGAQAAIDGHALGVGTDIEGFREDIIEIKLQAVAGLAAQGELAGIVGTAAETGPGVERGKFAIVKGVGSVDAIEVGAGWEAEAVENVDEIGGA